MSIARKVDLATCVAHAESAEIGKHTHRAAPIARDDTEAVVARLAPLFQGTAKTQFLACSSFCQCGDYHRSAATDLQPRTRQTAASQKLGHRFAPSFSYAIGNWLCATLLEKGIPGQATEQQSHLERLSNVVIYCNSLSLGKIVDNDTDEMKPPQLDSTVSKQSPVLTTLTTRVCLQQKVLAVSSTVSIKCNFIQFDTL